MFQYFSTLFLIFKFYPSKILLLLLLEVLFLSCICSFFFNNTLHSNGMIYFLFFLLVFLVLDSVIGVSLLVSIGRLSGFHSSWFF